MEFLNTLNEGMPPHELRLKRGAPIMLLRNIDPSNGLCNGTRLIVDSVVNNRLLKATIAGTEQEVLIPRIRLNPTDGTYPFKWSRRQFPVKMAAAITANKGQGQTYKVVAGDLSAKSVLSHGQLYVIASRVGNPACIRFLTPTNHLTRNVVYTEALLPPPPQGPGPGPGGMPGGVPGQQ